MEDKEKISAILEIEQKISKYKKNFPSKFDFDIAEVVFIYKKEQNESVYDGALQSALAGLKLMEKGIFVGIKSGGNEIKLFVYKNNIEEAKELLYGDL